jgi:valyl-tRNA synthetase
VEMAKVDLRDPGASPGERARVWRTAAESLAGMLRLLHPVMPFITERVWATLHELEPSLTAGEPLLVLASWPREDATDARAEAEMTSLMELVRGLRNLRTETAMPAASWLPLTVALADEAAGAQLTRDAPYVEALVRVRPIELSAPGVASPSDRPITAGRLGTAWLGAVATAEAGGAGARRDATIRELRGGVERLRTLLSNSSFVERAPQAVVERQRARLAELEAQLLQLERG